MYNHELTNFVKICFKLQIVKFFDLIHKHADHGHKKLLNRFFNQFFWTTSSKPREKSWENVGEDWSVCDLKTLFESLAAWSWSSFSQVSLRVAGFFGAHELSCAVLMRFSQVGNTNLDVKAKMVVRALAALFANANCQESSNEIPALLSMPLHQFHQVPSKQEQEHIPAVRTSCCSFPL
jgi:hypothetical protein